MNFVYFTHSLVSCWNHGNAHFQRGILRELVRRGHRVRALEPMNGWSRANLIKDHGLAPLDAFRRDFPELVAETYEAAPDPQSLVDGADVVIVHEWTDPSLVAALGALRKRASRFILLFHDSHHRAVSDPQAIRMFDLGGYDGILAFGSALAEVYRRWGWGSRVHVWHEAADTRLFCPPVVENERSGLIWIGNWGDGERSAEIERYLLKPANDLGLCLGMHGVRYPPQALDALEVHGARYRGWLPNARVPHSFASRLATVHIPRRFYVEALPGIPTIRVFEALACGIPLVSAPWRDIEGLFRPGVDYLVARSSGEMKHHLAALAEDRDLRSALAASGRETIRRRHTCAHRVAELLDIVSSLRPAEQRGAA